MLALALEILHFHQFCSTYHDIDTVNALIRSSTLEDNDVRDKLCNEQSFIKLFDEYSSYTQSTLDGMHGPTARFYMQ